jgi:UDP-2,3-diacylglucosamine hydrolase
MSLNIQESAIFIADAHYNHQREDLKILLQNIKLGKIKSTQLFLMGDIFDYLCEQISYFKIINNTLIELINELSNEIEIIYLEGNHDYNLEKLFPKVKVYNLKAQPLLATMNEQKVALSHGDIFISKTYEYFSIFIRSKLLLNILNFLDRCNSISVNIEKWLVGKDKSYKFENFSEFAKNRLKKYNHLKSDIVIEGHFHQGNRYNNYINLPSLIDLKYAQIVDGKIVFYDV